jgi:hypothetical protein
VVSITFSGKVTKLTFDSQQDYFSCLSAMDTIQYLATPEPSSPVRAKSKLGIVLSF